MFFLDGLSFVYYNIIKQEEVDGMAIPQKLLYTESDYYSLPEDVRAELIDGQSIIRRHPAGRI